MKKWCFAVILAFGGFLSLPAATISVLVVETGFVPGTEHTESAEVWESGAMDAFFEAGHIVSNAPILRAGEVPPSGLPREAEHDFDEARIGGSDYFVMILLSYPENAGEPRKIPKKVTIKLFSVSSGKLLYEVPVSAGVWENPDDEFLDARRNAEKVLSRLKGRE